MTKKMTGNQPLIAIGDKFSKLFQQQIEFQRKVEKLNHNYPLPHDDVSKFQYHVTAMYEEMGEVLKADKRWKTHRNTNFQPDEKLDEIADCYITLMNMSIWSGFDAKTIYDAIQNKIAENNKRIEKRS